MKREKKRWREECYEREEQSERLRQTDGWGGTEMGCRDGAQRWGTERRDGA